MTEQERVLVQAGLHERGPVLAELLAAYRAMQARGPVAVLLSGAAGSGKTSMLDVLRTVAERDGGTVLRATCSPLEVDFPFAVAQQLLGPGTSPTLAGEPFAVLDALYWALVARADDGPVVLLVDDVHWADDPSLRWLHFLLSRLTGLQVLPVLAARPSAGHRPLLAALATLPVVRQVPVPPLSVEAAARLLRGRVHDEVPDAVAARCREAAGGNPFYLSAMAVALREQGPARLEAALSTRTAPLPDVVSRAVLDRLRALGDDAVHVVRVVTVLGRDAQRASVSALSGLSEERVEDALAAAHDAGLLRSGPSPGVQHPIVHDAVYEDMPAEQRTRLHTQAARRLIAAGAEPERVALHLVVTEPGDDIWVVESLLAGARGAVRRGAPETAARYLRRALAEPLARHAAPLLLELGQAELLAGDLGAAARLRDALDLAADDATLSTAATLLSRALVYAGEVPEAVAVLRRTRGRLADPQGELAIRLDLEAINAAHLDARTTTQAEALLAGYADWSEHQPCGRLVLAHLSLEPARSGRSAQEAVVLARQALRDGALLEEHGADAQSSYLPIIALFLSDALDEARTHLDAAVQQSRGRSSVLGFCLAAAWRSHVALRAGDVLAAGADAEATLAAAGSAGLHVVTPYGVAFLSDVLVERGELAAADRLWHEHGLDGPLPPVLPANYLLFSRGSLRLAQARTAEAVQDLLDSGERQRLWRAPGPGFWPWASRAALGLHALGDQEQARRLVAQELEAAQAFGADRPTGMALHAAALLERGQARLQGLQRAAEVLAGSAARLEHARVLVDLGGAMLRTGRRSEGIAAVEDGLRRAASCGATALCGRARAELVAAGISPRRGALDGVEALTISERRVAQLAAAGSTNREIAQALFVTPKTVETHLARAFRKLGLSSRRELAGVPGLLDGGTGAQAGVGAASPNP